MIKTIYSRALTVLSRKPFRLWGLSLLSSLLITLASALFGVIPGLAVALSWLLSVSMTMVFLHGYLGEDVKIVNLFDCFADWGTVKRVLCGVGLTVLRIFLWALIPFAGIVFAIIRAYEYALVPYILVNEPEIPIAETLEVSKKRMDGFKGKMFWADMLWILIVWAAMLVLSLLGLIPYVGVIFKIAVILICVCVALFGSLFKGLVDSAFYVEIQRETGEGPQFDDSMNNPTEKPKHVTPHTYTPAGDFKFCPMCGTRNPVNGKFCISCGNAFVSFDAPAAPAYPDFSAPTDSFNDNTPEE